MVIKLIIKGEIYDNYYLILKGNVSVLIVKEIKMLLSEEEYINYLRILNYYDETEIFSKCLSKNRPIYFVNERILWHSSKR